MEKRECAQVGIPEKLAKLKRWRDHPEWSTRAAAKELGVPRGTLLGWKKELWTKLDDAEFAEAIDGRIRAKTCKPQRKLASYELQILEYHDTCLREDGKVVHGDLVKYGRIIPEFAIRNDGTQLSWISWFMVMYKTESSDRPIPADGDGSDNCVGDSVQNKDEKASSDEEKAPAEEENAPLKKKKILPEEKTPLEEKQMPPEEKKVAPEEKKASPAKKTSLEEKEQQKDPPHREPQLHNPRKRTSSRKENGHPKPLSSNKRPRASRRKVPLKSPPIKKTSDDEWDDFVTKSSQRRALRKRRQNGTLFTAVHKIVRDGASDEIIRIPIDQEDLNSLGPDQWVTSAAIDCLGYLHMQRVAGLVYPLGSLFFSEIESAYGKFVDGEELPEETTGAFDWHAHRYILLPIAGEDHYSFVIIEHPRHPEKAILYHVNSYRGLHASADVFAVLKWFLADERKKKKMESVSSDPQSLSYFTKPRQSNDQDCGVYMLRYMDKVASYITQNEPATLLDSIEGLVNGKFSASHARRKRELLHEALQADIVEEHVVE